MARRKTAKAFDVVDARRVGAVVTEPESRPQAITYGELAIRLGLSGGTWPVGSVFSAVVSTNPAILLGFGTWVLFGLGFDDGSGDLRVDLQ